MFVAEVTMGSDRPSVVQMVRRQPPGINGTFSNSNKVYMELGISLFDPFNFAEKMKWFKAQQHEQAEHAAVFNGALGTQQAIERRQQDALYAAEMASAEAQRKETET